MIDEAAGMGHGVQEEHRGRRVGRDAIRRNEAPIARGVGADRWCSNRRYRS